MPRTPEEEAEFQSLSAQFNPPEPEGFWSRLGRGAANIPGYLASIPAQTAVGLTGLISGDENLQREAKNAQLYQPYTLPPAQGGAELTADIATRAVPEIIAAAAPMSLLSKGAQALGAAPRIANLIGSTATGLLSGSRSGSSGETATQAGEFAIGQAAADFIPGGTIPKALMRAAAQSAVPIAGQAVRGHDPLSQEGLIQSATQAGMQLIGDRGSFRRVPVVEPAPRPLMKKSEAVPEPAPVQEAGDTELFDQVFWQQKDLVPAPRDDLGTVPATEGDVMSMIPKREPPVEASPQASPEPTPSGPRIVSTGILTPEGVAQGPSWNTKHADISKLDGPGKETILKALDEGMEADQLDANKGFIVEENGKQRFVGRREALEIARKSGQVDEAMLYDPEGHGLISEALIEPGKKAEPMLEVVTAKEMVPPSPERTEATQAKSLEDTLSLLKKPGHEKPMVPNPREALKRSMQDANERLNAAKAMGDADEVGAIQQEINVISKKMRALNEPQERPKIPLKKDRDKLMLPLGGPIRATVGASLGYLSGDTEEERMRNAVLFGGASLLGPIAAKNLIPKVRNAMEAAARNEVRAESGKPRTLLGKITRQLETKFNLNRSQETVLAQEKGKGALSQLGHEVEDTLRKNYPEFDQAIKDPAQRAIGEEFLNSAGSRADVAKLDAAPVPQGYKDVLKSQKAAQREAQLKLRNAESDPRKRALYASTLGSYQTRLYRIDSDPKMWSMDDATLQKVVDQFQNGPLKGVDRGVIERNLRQGLAERRNGTDPFLDAGGNKIKQTLFEHKIDLTPDQWGFIDQMARDPRTPPGADKVLADFFTNKTIDPAGQQFLRALAGNKKLSDVEKAMFREMADKRILTQEYRDLLGEIKDPFERQLYTLNKLFGSVKQAETISQIADMTQGGMKMAMDGAEWSAALSDPNFKQRAEGYVQLDDVPGFGKLAGKYVPRDVKDALEEMATEMPKWFRVIAQGNNWVKEMATAWNPTVHLRQAAQSPMFLMAARVGPWEIPQALKGLSIALKAGDPAMMKELRQQHIVEANYGHQELRSWADKIALGKQKNFLRRARDTVSGIYGIPDDFVRISAYLKHRKRYEAEGVKKGLSGSDLERYARDKATIFVNEHTMNYGQVSKGIKVLRNIPGMSPFASYSAEMLRLTKNLVKDVAQGSASDKVWGLTGLATLYAVPVAISQYARSKFLTPEQQEVWDDTERLMPDSDRSNLKIPKGVNSKGSFEFINLNPLTPAGDVVSTVKNVYNGDWNAFAYSQPFFGLSKNPLASAVVDTAITGEHGFTHEKLDEPLEKLSRVGEAVLPSLAPPSGFMYKRAVKSLTPNDDGTLGQVDPRTGTEYNPRTLMMSLGGVGERVANPEMLKRSAGYKLREQLEQEANQLKRVMRSGAPQSQKDKALMKYDKKRAEILSRIEE